MHHAFDPYPTRQPERHEPLPRREAVVHGADSHGPLGAAELTRFERDGYLHLEGFFKPHEVRAFLEDLEAYRHDADLLARPEVIAEPDSDAIRSIFSIHWLSSRFEALTRDARLLDMAQQLLGSEVYVHQSRLNRKPAFHGRGFDWHSDFETWHAEDGMPAMRCVSISVSLCENSDLNGPLLLIPGSHHTFYPTVGATPERYWETSLRRQRVGVPELSDLQRATGEQGVVSMRGGIGSVVLFDCNALHASADNLSPEPRSNLFLVYNSVENTLQAPFAAAQPRPEWLANRAHTNALGSRREQRTVVA